MRDANLSEYGNSLTRAAKIAKTVGMSTQPLVTFSQHDYRGLLVSKPAPGATVTFAHPSLPKKFVAIARLRTGNGWSLRIEGHVWAAPENHPLNSIPGDSKVTTLSFRAFPTWQAAAREVIKVLGIQPERSYEGFNGPIRQSDVLAYWHDTGAMGAQLCYVRVIKLARKRIKVRYETSLDEAWVEPHHFAHTVRGATLEELLKEGLRL